MTVEPVSSTPIATAGNHPLPHHVSAQVLMIGAGRMGGNMARRLGRGGVRVAVYDADAEARRALDGEPSVSVFATLEAAIAALPAPRIAWVMLPAGDVTHRMLEQLGQTLQTGDVVVDGGNARYLDAPAHAARLAERGIEFVDCGVSGGIRGLDNGYCLMFGGSTAAAARLEPLMRVLAPAPDHGWLHCGAVGAGHFAKMVHNGIEYGMMQALAEGFALVEGQTDLAIDSARLAELWRHGSVVRSWLLDLTADALADPDALAAVAPVVADSGEGRWTVEEAIRQGTPVPVIALALMTRFDSQGQGDTGNRLLSLMRKGFGGHATVAAKREQ
jgi:6-phosphogluconate dehydrogenase